MGDHAPDKNQGRPRDDILSKILDVDDLSQPVLQPHRVRIDSEQKEIRSHHEQQWWPDLLQCS